jgi:DNA-binding GntR family transcriptional regulator
MRNERPIVVNLATQVYERVKQDIFDFRLLPGDRFTESEVAERTQASRTPVREALYRLERDGYLEVMFRAGWRVRPFDFRQFEELYDLRIVLESTAVRRLCEADARPELDALRAIWTVPAGERETEMREVARLDEAMLVLHPLPLPVAPLELPRGEVGFLPRNLWASQ